MKNKKFYLVHLYDDYSGSPNVLSQLAKVLLGNKISCEAFLGKSSKGFISDTSIPVTEFYYKRSEFKLLVLLLYILSQVNLFFILSYRLFKERKYEQVVIVNTLLPFGAALSAKLLGVQVCYYCHEVSLKPAILMRFLKFIANFTASKFIYVSSFVRDELRFCTDIDSEVIYNIVPEEYSNCILSTENVFSKWNVGSIIMPCSLKDYKGIPEFIKLASLFSKDSNFKFELIINDSDLNAIEYLRAFTIPSNVSYVCKPIDLVKRYKESFIVVNLSDQNAWVETFGLTLIEGMSQSSPVIAPLVGGPKEFVKNGLNGYLIDSKDFKLLKATIFSLKNDFEKWSLLSENARKTSEEFTFFDYQRNILNFLNCLTNS